MFHYARTGVNYFTAQVYVTHYTLGALIKCKRLSWKGGSKGVPSIITLLRVRMCLLCMVSAGIRRMAP